jgi:hypothetical protein
VDFVLAVVPLQVGHWAVPGIDSSPARVVHIFDFLFSVEFVQSSGSYISTFPIEPEVHKGFFKLNAAVCIRTLHFVVKLLHDATGKPSVILAGCGIRQRIHVEGKSVIVR